MPFDMNSVIVRAADMMTAPVDQDLIILNADNNIYIGLDDIGRAIWDMMDSPRSVDDLWRHLCREYSGDPGEIATDLLSLLHELAAEGLVRGIDIDA